MAEAAPKEPRFWYFGPHGYPMHDVVTRGWQSAPLIVNNSSGSIDTDAPGDFPSMEPYTGRQGSEFLSDEDSTEFLQKHCRLVEVYDDFDSSDFDLTTEPALTPWPDHVVAACIKAANLEDMAQAFEEAEKRAPNYLDDTQKLVLKRFIFGKIDAQLEELETLIEGHRQAHPDPERLTLDEETEETEDAAV